MIVLLVSPSRGRDSMMRITHVARLGARGLATSLAAVRHPDETIQRIAALELLD